MVDSVVSGDNFTVGRHPTTRSFMQACQSRLDDIGFVVVDSGVVITDRHARVAAEAVSKRGRAIFEDVPAQDQQGPRLDVGTQQRKQLRLSRMPLSIRLLAAKLQAMAVEPFVRPLPLNDHNSFCLVSDPFVCGKHGKVSRMSPGGPQALHTDVAPFSPPCKVAIAALEDDTSLLIVPFSHKVIKAFGAFGDNKESQNNPLASIMPTFPLIRLVLKRGQVVVMDGHLVHAGDEGKAGLYSPRIHWFAMEAKEDNSTFPVVDLGPDIAAKFTPAPVRKLS